MAKAERAPFVLVQRQLEKVRVAANEWVLLFWLRLVLRVSLAWRSFWSRAAKMALLYRRVCRLG